MVQCSLWQMLENGYFHADTHLEILLAESNGNLCYLDFGMTLSRSPSTSKRKALHRHRHSHSHLAQVCPIISVRAAASMQSTFAFCSPTGLSDQLRHHHRALFTSSDHRSSKLIIHVSRPHRVFAPLLPSTNTTCNEYHLQTVPQAN